MNKWLILFCAFLVFVSACKDDASKSLELAAKCDAGDKEAFNELKDIAKNSTDWEICDAVVENITDKAVLARIVLEIEDRNRGYTAIKKLSDQASLAIVAADDKDWRVRLIFKFLAAFDSVPTEHRERLMTEILPAIRVLSYPEVVSIVGDIVSIKTEWKSTSKDYWGTLSGSKQGEDFTCSIEVRKLSEPVSYTWKTDFLSIITSLHFEPARINAANLLKEPLSRITDRKLLTNFAKNDKDIDVRMAAVKQLADKALLAEIAKEDEDIMVRISAIKNPNLTDQSVLAEIARNNGDTSVRTTAVEKMNDQKILAGIARTATDSAVRVTTVMNPNLTDQVLLTVIAMSDDFYGVRAAAVERLIDQKIIAEIAKNDKDVDVREAAERRLKALQGK